MRTSTKTVSGASIFSVQILKTFIVLIMEIL